MVGFTFSFLLSALSLLIPFLSMLLQSLFIAFSVLVTAYQLLFYAFSMLLCFPCFPCFPWFPCLPASLLSFASPASPAFQCFPCCPCFARLPARSDRVHCRSHRSETSKRIEFYLPPPCWTENVLLLTFFFCETQSVWFEIMPGREDLKRTEKKNEEKKDIGEKKPNCHCPG